VRASRNLYLLGAWCVLTAACGARAGDVAMQKPTAYPHAGVALSLPEGFSIQLDSDPFLVVRAVRARGSKASQAVTLSAYPVAEKVTTDSYADAMAEQLGKSLAIRNLKILKKRPIPVAGVTGSAARMSYSYRGVDTVAARVYFIREVKNRKLRICYVLTVESTPDLEKTLLPTLSCVIKSVKWVGVQAPSELALAAPGPAVVVKGKGYSIRPPAGWFAGEAAIGAFMGQADYLRGAQPTITMSVLTLAAGAKTTCRQICEGHLKRALAEAKKRNLRAEVLSNGPAAIGALKGHQFVLRQSQKTVSSTQEAAPEPPVVIVQRTVLAPRGGGKGVRAHSLVLICQGTDPAKARKIMDHVASSFRVLPTPGATTTTTSAPASAPGK